MTNTAIAQLISARLRSGLTHPGDPENNVPPKPIMLPFGTTAGMPKEMSDLMDATVTMLGEAIVALIEGEGETDLVPRGELEDLRTVAAEAPEARIVPVYCRCDRKHTDPLMLLNVDGRPRIVVDGKQLIGGLSRRAAECPHGREGR